MSFKTCTSCRYDWDSRKSFLSDPDVRLLGYQVNFAKLEAGFFLFSHDALPCRTTLAIEAGKFTDMHQGPIFETRMTNTAECRGYCLHKTSLDPCENACECAYVRDVLRMVKTWPKEGGNST